MKKQTLLSLLLLLLLAACNSKEQEVIKADNRAEEIRNDLFNPHLERVLVVAHRADWRNYPENSLAAIESAIQMGVDIIELDVQQSQDSVLVVMHDRTLNRTTTGKGSVSETPFDSIRTLFLKNGCAIKTKHRVPTLEEALLACKGRVLINLDKADRYFEQIYDLLQKTGTTKQVVMKGSKTLDEVKTLYGNYLSEVIYMPVVHLDRPNGVKEVEEFVENMQPVAFELLFQADSCQAPQHIKNYLKGKSLIWYNTLWDTLAGGHDDDMSLTDPDGGYGYLIETLGARIIQTDRPAALIEYLRSINRYK